jgi:hypothetical protein
MRGVVGVDGFHDHDVDRHGSAIIALGRLWQRL